MPLNIIQPAANALFAIDATPRMPTLACSVRITGIQPDPTASTSFDWSLKITETVNASTCASSRVGTCTLTVNQAGVQGGMWTPTFNAIQGGDAVITVVANLQGAALQASVNVRIRGTNPPAERARRRIALRVRRVEDGSSTEPGCLCSAREEMSASCRCATPLRAAPSDGIGPETWLPAPP